ncbi:class I adenylate-forming enzyme family protein [Afifella sp. IM 167]|uniref:class I adenylate-forming enzyme family protein n=1 Tax=Afifella sp. IM 167 TaxID=2033586 RepID=UPI001CCB4614|nr:class I adenylate-forming enzyme family protein [Afifella sp. IM 167]MBZ8134348.1 AMP-dependent synthetase [Afifella sp. IM 167]
MITDFFNLGDLIDRSQDQARTAIVDLRDPAAPRSYTYGEMDLLSGGIARHLSARGLPPGARVAIASMNRAEYIAAYFGIMRAGLVAVPVNIKLPDEIIAFLVEDADVALAFTDAGSRARLPAGLPVIDFDNAGPDGFAALIEPAAFETVVPREGALAQILYTSGSTGRPKGVLLSHEGQLWVLKAKAVAPEMAESRQIIAQPLFHMNGLIVTKCAFLAGALLVMMPSFKAAEYTAAMAQYRVTHVMAIPTMFARVVKELEKEPEIDLSSLVQIVLASAPLTLALIDRVEKMIPSATVANSFGTTEAGASVFGPHPDGLPTPPLSLGHPLPGSEVKLVDGPDENHGTLMMRNPAVMTGYNKLPKKTAEVIRDGWYISGDVMRRDENGFFFFFGRADDMFVCSGENIYPNEVEKLLERHPKVQQAAVVPMPDEERGHIPVAFIVAAAGTSPAVEEIKAFSIANGPAYQHPRRIELRADLPLAGTNKIDRNALMRRARDLETAGGWST